MCKLFVISRNSFFLQALKTSVDSDLYQILGSAVALADVIQSSALHETKCDVLVLDGTGHHEDMMPRLRALKILRPMLKILVITEEFDLAVLGQLFSVGCAGCLLSNIGLPALNLYLGLIASGLKVFPDQVAEFVCVAGRRAPRLGAGTAFEAHLTPREAHILDHLVNGLQNKQIAGQLDVPVTTVKADLKTLMRKTGSNNRTELAICAVRRGWGAVEMQTPAA